MSYRHGFSADLQRIRRHIDQMIKLHGFVPEALGWTRNKQHHRFQVLCDIGVRNSCSIIDFGCGLADLYAYCRSRFDKIKYLGVEINPALVDECRRKYPEIDVRCMDILTDDLNEQVDFVLISGTFNYPFRFSDNYGFIEASLTELFKIARIGIAADFFSTSVDYRTEELFYSDPKLIFDIAQRLSKRVTLRHDYFPFEFCIYLYTDDSITNRYVFRRFEEEAPI